MLQYELYLITYKDFLPKRLNLKLMKPFQLTSSVKKNRGEKSFKWHCEKSIRWMQNITVNQMSGLIWLNYILKKTTIKYIFDTTEAIY